jgi:glutamate-1-semialdehyde 2,1-aminomutase
VRAGVTPEAPTRETLGRQAPASLARMARAGRRLAGGKLSSQDSKPYPLVVARARGVRLTDLDGREWLDFNLGHGPLILGHDHPEVRDAVQAQLARGVTWGAFNEAALDLAEEIARAVPGVESLRFTASGTEAVETAIRFARAYTGRTGVVRFEGAYHGHGDIALLSGKLSHAPAGLADEPVPDSRPFVDSAGIPASVADDCFVAPFNNLAVLERLVSQHAHRLACVLVEPALLCLVPPAPGFLAAAHGLARRHGVLLVFDEVVTGFRVARGGAQALYGVRPDLTVLGKITGGGFPNGVVGGPGEIMDPLFEAGSGRHVFHAGTFCGHPVASAAGLAQIRVLEREGWHDRLVARGAAFRAALGEVLARCGVAGRVLGVGPAWGVRFLDREVVDYRTGLGEDAALAHRVHLQMWSRGMLYSPVRNYLATAHQDRDLDQALAALEASIRAALDSGVGPARGR